MKLSTILAAHRRSVAVVCSLAVIACLCGGALAGPMQPSSADRQIAVAVTSLLGSEHISGRQLDDQISQRCLDLFLKSFDPWKVYFYQSDVDSFMKHQNELDDSARKGDIGFAYTVFKVFLQRVDERVQLVEELLAQPQDFTVDETMVSDRDKAAYPRTAEEARDLWRKRIKYDLLVLKADKTE